MPSYQQADRLLTVTTPLGSDKLLLVGLVGTEAISQLFQFQLNAIATHETQIPFDQLLGKKVTAHINAPGGDHRHISGICSRAGQGGRDATFTYYQLEIVPELWFLTAQDPEPDLSAEVGQGDPDQGVRGSRRADPAHRPVRAP